MLRTFSRTNKIICIASNHTLKTLLILTFFPCTLTFSLPSSLSFFPFSLARRHYSFCFTVSFLRFLFFYIFFSFFFFIRPLHVILFSMERTNYIITVICVQEVTRILAS